MSRDGTRASRNTEARLEKLLRDLSALETSTKAALATVREVLAGEPVIEKRVPKAVSQKPLPVSRARKPPQKSPSAVDSEAYTTSTTKVKYAQQVVRTCLKTLTTVASFLNGDGGNLPEETQKKVPRGSLKPDLNGHDIHRAFPGLKVLYECFCEAILVWDRGKNQSAKDQLAIPKSRYNLATRLLDLHLFDEFLQTIHEIWCTLTIDSCSENPLSDRAPPARSTSYQYILCHTIERLSTEDQVSDEAIWLAMNMQALVVRYWCLLDTTIDHDYVVALQHPHGPSSWCDLIAKSDEPRSIMYRTNLIRAVTRLLPKASSEVRCLASGYIARNMLALPSPDYINAIDMFCKSLELSNIENRNISETIAIAERLLHWATSEGTLVDQNTVLVMIERVAKHASYGGHFEIASDWTTIGAKLSPSTTSLVFRLDRLSLHITQTNKDGLPDHLMSDIQDLIDAPPTEDHNEHEHRNLVRSMTNLRSRISKYLKSDKHKNFARKLYSLLLHMILNLTKAQAPQSKTPLSVLAGDTIKSWLSLYVVESVDSTCLERLKQVESLLGITSQLEIPLSKTALGTVLYNVGGHLYTAKRYLLSAKHFELCFSSNCIDLDAKKLEYLWSAYLLANETGPAFAWLTSALRSAALSIIPEHIDVVDDLRGLYPELCRIVAKLTKITQEFSEYEFPTLSDLTAGAQGVITELYLRELHILSSGRGTIETFQAAIDHGIRIYRADETLVYECFRLVIDALVILSTRFESSPQLNPYFILAKELRGKLFTNEPCRALALIDIRYTIVGISQVIPDDIGLHNLLDAVRKTMLTLTSQQPHGQFCLVILSELRDVARKYLPRKFATEIAEITLHLNDQLDILDIHQILGLYLDTAENNLVLGYDGKAFSWLRTTEKLIRDLPSGNLGVRSRFICLQLRYAALVKNEDLQSKTLLALRDLVTNSVAKSSALEWQGFALDELAVLAESRGALTAAVILELESVGTKRKLIHRNARKLATESSVEAISQDLGALTIFENSTERPYMLDSLAKNLFNLARLYLTCGAIKESRHYLQEAKESASNSGDGLVLAHLVAWEIQVLHQVGKPSEGSLLVPATSTHDLMLQLENMIAQSYLLENDQIDQCITVLENAKSLLLLARKASRDAVKQISVLTNGKTAAKEVSNVEKSTLLLDSMYSQVLCRLLAVCESASRAAAAAACLEEINAMAEDRKLGDMHYLVAVSKLRCAESLLVSDPIYGVLHDSALSLPNICRPSSDTVQPKSRGRKVQRAIPKDVSEATKIKRILEDAKAQLAAGFHEALIMGRSYTAHRSSVLFANINLVHAALSDPNEDPQLRSLTSSYLLESSRAQAISREKTLSSITIRNSSAITWDDSLRIANADIDVADSNFQATYIDCLPLEWNVVSIGLSQSGNDLVISRIQAGRKPLILRLPMSRHTSRDVDEDTFTYKEAETELLQIVQLSDQAAQNAKDIKDKKGKTDWWNLRQGLDTRMKTLLDNIEHCWLGGFRGILGHSRFDASNSQQFHQSFARIVLKHVPYRKLKHFDLDARILDLFTDLGRIDGPESLELLEDLLYFVLDIFQFHGEAIAYDEIDLDQMVVEIQSALNIYHDDMGEARDSAHVILMLDKSMHGFPWESMPCLKHKSVSRVPSLASLKSLLKSQTQPSEILIQREPGHFILNPGQDLKSTEKTFAPVLDVLPGWTGITGRKPEERELLEYLETGSIYIYFGHGGGEQYARASKIKKIRNCCVAILMGCSSGALRNQGLFDPWGTPYNYMVAECPCLVANLWDVTDKDIDRFSLKMLSTWGLTSDTAQGIALSLAVAQSRDECLLTYLNGAAPVVYGLPVYLAPSPTKAD